MRWLHFNEVLPRKGQRILVCSPEEAAEGYMELVKYRGEWQRKWLWAGCICYWMPLPKRAPMYPVNQRLADQANMDKRPRLFGEHPAFNGSLYLGEVIDPKNADQRRFMEKWLFDFFYGDILQLVDFPHESLPIEFSVKHMTDYEVEQLPEV